MLLVGAVFLSAAAQGASAESYEEAVEGTSGVAHFWPMGESSGSSFADVVGGANAEVSSSGVTLGEPGGLVEDLSTSAAFDGSSGAAQASINLTGTHELTVEFWMKWHAYGADDRLALEFTPNFNSNPGGFIVDPDATPGSDFAVTIGNGSHYNNVMFERPSAETWHYYAFVIDTEEPAGSEITPYVDGRAVPYTKLVSDTGAGNFASSTLFWMSRDASTLFGAGSMQDLALYDTTLSPSTILEHYALGEHAPQAAFSSAPVVATAGVPVHFDASGSKSPGSSITDYAWDFDGGKGYGTDGGSSPTVTHTFSTAGTYTVDLRVTNGASQTGTVSRTITVGETLPAYERAVEDTGGLAHFWPMGDSSGSSLFADVFDGADASVSGGVTLGESGALAENPATSALFNGSTGAAQANIDLSSTHELTIEFWMKWHAYGADDRLAMEFTPNFNSYTGGFLVDPDATPGSDFAVSIGKGGTANTVLFERPSAEEWHYYAFVIDTEEPGEAEITPYVDGHAVSYTKSASNTGAGAFADSTLFWMSRDASTLFGEGSMQDLALYDTTLSSGTILEHYDLGEGGPRASFASTPVAATAGVPVHLDASGSSSPTGSITDYAWDFDGSKAYGTDAGSSASETHTFSTAGTYTVDLRVKDSTGATATVSHTITVSTALGQYEQAVEDTGGLAHFWPMNESSGSSLADVFDGANATTSGGVTLGEPGGLVEDSSTSTAFDGSSGAAQANVNLSGTHELTIEFWMKWHEYGADDKLALEFTPNFNEHPGGFLVDPDATPGSDFAVAIGQSSAGHNNNVLFERPSAEHWHYYAFVINTEASGETEITPYVDGHAVSYTKLDSETGAGNFASSTLYWMSRDADNLFGAGSMQDLALYDTTLSAEAILEHYERGENTYDVTNTTAPSIEGTAEGGQVLTAKPGSWSGYEPISYAYQWRRCDSSGASCTNISGATGSTYVLGHSDVGATLRVVVTGSNAGSSASATSEPTGVVSPAEAPLVYSGQFGSGGSEAGEFSHPGDVAVDGSGNLWVLDHGNDRVEEFNAAGEYLRGFGSAGSGAGELEGPDGLAIDSKGDIWIADTGNERVDEFNDEGEFLRTVGVGLVGVTEGIAVDHDEDVWVSGTSAGQLVVFNKSGEYLKTVGSRGSGVGEMGEPEGLAVDTHGDIWVADWSDNRVEEFNESGEYVQEFGSYGSTEGKISHPYGIAVDPSGSVWLGEVGSDRLQEFTEEGEYVASLGVEGSGAELLSLSYPIGLTINTSGDLWVTDPGANRIAEWVPNTPSAPSNTMAPEITGEPLDGAILTASAGRWTGVPSPTHSYQWQRCNESGGECANISGATSHSYTLGSSDTGKKIRILVTASNSAGSATADSSPTAVITLPAAPSNTVPPEISGITQAGQTLSASTGTWTSAVPISYSYQWKRCDLFGAECATISGATASTYVPVSADVEHTLIVQVTATNPGGSNSATSLATSEVLHGLPVNTLVPVLSSSTPQEGVTDSVSTGTWTDEPTSYSYQWQSCNESGEECANIEEATEETYEPGPGDVGNTLRAVVTASNAGGSVSVASESSAAVGTGATAPLSLAQPEISGRPEVGEILSASTGTWAGTPRLSYAYQWESCDSSGESCADIEGATEKTYRVATSDILSTLRVLVTASNSDGNASRISMASGMVRNLPGTEEACTDTWIGGSNGSWENPLGWSTGSVPGVSDVACVGPETTIEIPEDNSNQVGVLRDEGELVIWHASLELTDASQASTVSALSLPDGFGGGGTLTGEGSLYVSAYLEFSGGTISGSGQIILMPTATGTLHGGDFSRTLINEGTLTLAEGGFFNMSGGALLENRGTFLASSQACCVSQLRGFEEGGETPRILNTGTFEKAEGSGTTSVAIRFTNDGAIRAISGTLKFEDGGVSGEAATGSWSVEGGAAITLNSGTFTVGEAVNLTGVSVEGGATVTRAPAPANTTPPAISGSPEEGHTLTASGGSWSGAEPISLSYQWQRCNSTGEKCGNISGATGSTYVVSSGDGGSTVRVTVIATNASGFALASSAASATVAASAPSNTASPSITGTAQDGETLTADKGTWSGSSPISYTYQWESCNPSGEECAAIEEASSPEYDLTEGDIGSTLRVIVTAINIGGSAEATSSASTVIQAEPPSELEAPSISGVPDVHEVLDADPGVWTGNEPQFSYQWESCSESGTECAAIEGATSSEYDLTEGDLSSTLRVRIGVGSARDSLSDVSHVTPVIGAAQALSSTRAPTVSGVPQAGQALTTRLGTWSGGEGAISDAYQWQSCNSTGSGCEDISGATSAIYVPVSGNAGHRLRVVLTATDAHEHHASRASQDTQPVAAAKAPAVEQSPVVTGPGLAGQTLTTGTGVFAGEGPISYAYQWERCEASGACHTIEGATHSYYTLTEADVGSTVLVLVSAGDTEGSTTAVSSPTAVVGPESLLELAAPSISGTVQSEGTLSAEPGIWSATGLVTYAYQWERCNTAGAECKAIEGATEQDYAPASGDLGSTLRVKVSVTSPLGSTSAFSQHTVTTPSGEVSPEEAIEVAQHADPALLAASTTTSLEEHSIAPALVDGEEDISSTSTLTSSTISKEVPGEFSINTPEDEVSLTPLETSPNATTTPTIVNGAAAVFANTWPATDTIVRPDALGATTLLQLRSAAAPTSFSWELGLGADQELRELPGGGVAIVDPTEAPPEPEPEPEAEAEGPESTGEDTPLNELPEEREPVEEEEEKEEEAGPEHPPAAPTQSTSSGEPGSGLPQPQQTLSDYEAGSAAMTSSEGESPGDTLMVIEPPTVKDAEGHTVPASLTANGDTITLKLTLSPTTPFPVIVDPTVAGHTDKSSAASAHKFRYGLAAAKPGDLTHAGLHPEETDKFDSRLRHKPLSIGTTRLVVAYDVLTSHSLKTEKQRLIQWLQAAKKENLEPFITLGPEHLCEPAHPCSPGPSDPSVDEYRKAIKPLLKALVRQEHVDGLPRGLPQVIKWGAWNEPDLNTTNQKNPLRHLADAPKAAQFWEVAKAVLSGKHELHCYRCTMVAGEFEEDTVTVNKDHHIEPYHRAYIERYRNTLLCHKSCKAMRFLPWPERPHVWGLHDYSDLIAGGTHKGIENKDAKNFVKLIDTKALGNPFIWLSEQGVDLQNGDEETPLYHKESPPTTNDARQRKAGLDFLTLDAVSKHIERVNYYMYSAPEKNEEHLFDSALLDENLNARPVYCVIVYINHKCPPSVKTGGNSRVHGGNTSGGGGCTFSEVSIALAGQVNPNGFVSKEKPTTYYFQYGTEAGHYTTSTKPKTIESSDGTISVKEEMGLKTTREGPGGNCKTIYYRIVANNEGGTTFGKDSEITFFTDEF